MGVPWVLYDYNDADRMNLKGRGIIVSFLIELAGIAGVDVQDYWRRARNIVRNVGYQATGEPSGVHGVFHKYETCRMVAQVLTFLIDTVSTR